MLLIVVTGGIAAGKTYVTNIFKQLNIPVINADHIAKELIYTDQQINNKIKQYFNISDLENNIKKIKIKIFHNKKHRLFLERLVHPKVIEKIILQIRNFEMNKDFARNYCVIEIPMVHNLREILKIIKINKMVFVDCNENLQISRSMHRDQLSKSQVILMIKSQMSEKFLYHASDYILNGNSLNDLRNETLNLHKKLFSI